MPNEFTAVLDLHGPVHFAFLANERKRRVGNGAPAKRAGTVRRINFHVIRQRENFLVQRIVKFPGKCARIFVCVAKIGPADIIHEKQIAGENDNRLFSFAHKKRETIGRMTGRFEQFDVERADLHTVAILRCDMLVCHRCEMRDVNFGAGALRQFAKTGSEIGVRMTVENGDDPKPFAFRFRDVIVHIAFRIDHRGFTIRAEEIRSMRESFNKKAF